MSSNPLRKLTLPPKDRPHWAPREGWSSPLLYLAWGARQYGLSSIPATCHDGWTYIVVEAGSPILVSTRQRERVPAATLLVIGPECAFGWEDEGRHSSRLFASVWREPAHPVLRSLPPADISRYALSAAQIAEFQTLQSLCLKEVRRPRDLSVAVFSALQTLLETAIARVKDETEGGADQLGQAMAWIESHLTTRQPLARLSDYLGVSAATIQRIFRERLGRSVMHTIAELRCREADRLLAQRGSSIKQVAYQLGYRHPHDFSRAYLKHTGKPPRPLY